jgi:hypothetical protein
MAIKSDRQKNSSADIHAQEAEADPGKQSKRRRRRRGNIVGRRMGRSIATELEGSTEKFARRASPGAIKGGV